MIKVRSLEVHLKKGRGASEMAQKVKALAAEPGNLSSVPDTYYLVKVIL